MAPDFAFVRADRLPPVDHLKRPLILAPDLVAEAILQGTSGPAIARDLEDWQAAGVPLVRVVDVRRRMVTARSPARSPRV